MRIAVQIESEFTEFWNFQNNGNNLFIFSISFWKFLNFENSDSDNVLAHLKHGLYFSVGIVTMYFI